LDVIEHIEDAGHFLRRCRERFKNAKGIVVTVPARAELWSNYDVRYTHFRRYDLGLLRDHAAKGGYRVEDWSYAYHSLYAPLRLVLALGLDRSVILKSPRFLPLHAALGWLLDLEQRLLPRSIPGTTLIAVLKPL
jgi:hypothetical protein